MATAVVQRASRRSAPERIEADLAGLWREVAQEGGDVSRAIMSNLVIYCRSASGADLDLSSAPNGAPVDDVARNHPARIVLIHHDADASASLSIEVAVLVFGGPDMRYGVERIVIRTGAVAEALPSIVRHLILGDAPTSIWWTEDVSEKLLLAPLVAMGRQLVYDSRRWRDLRTAALTLAPLMAERFAPDLADVNWRRLTAVRSALTPMMSPNKNVKRERLLPVQLRHRPGEASLAWLFAGWLHAAAAEGGRIVSDSSITVSEDDALDAPLTASFADGLQLRLGDDRMRVEDPLGPAPFTLMTPRETGAESVAAELNSLTRDASLYDALAALSEHYRQA